MDLQEFTSGSPSTKPWLNIVADSISAESAYFINNYSLGHIRPNDIGLGPFTLTATEVVNGLVSCTASSATVNYTLPSATDIDAIVGALPNFTITNFSFKLLLYAGLTTVMQLTLGSGCLGVNFSSVIYVNGQTRPIVEVTYSKTGFGNWNVYAAASPLAPGPNSSLTLSDEVGVPDAPVGATTFWSSGLGNFSQTDNNGTTVTYAATSGSFLPLNGSEAMTGNLDMGTNNLINANSLVINEVMPSNPPAGQIAIYSQFDNIFSLDSSGGVRQYLNGADPVVEVSPTSSVIGNIPEFAVTTDGKTITDSGIPASVLIRSTGAVPMAQDLILKNGSAAIGSVFSMAPQNGPAVTNTTVATSLLGPVIGSLTLPAGTGFQQGTILRFVSNLFIAQSLAGHTLTFSINMNSVSIWSYTFTPGAGANIQVRLEVDMISSNGSSYGCYGLVFVDGMVPVIKNTGASVDNSVPLVYDFTAQWSVASTSDVVGAQIVYVNRQF